MILFATLPQPHRRVGSLADIGVERERLLEGHPDGRGVYLLDRLQPQHQDNDALVGDAVGAQGPHDAPFPISGAPRFQPGPDAALKLHNDAVARP
jgi:hypothetical protein